MPGPETQRIEKALKGITIGAAKDLRKAEERAYADGLIEREEQFQVAISGSAEEFLDWQIVELKFGTMFVDASGQRDSELERPHFTYGAEIETPTPVGILACVLEWLTTARNETIGCKLAIGVAASDRAVRFKGFLHANFQGFGQPRNSFMPEDIGTG
jgi:hypothetical protein